MKGFKSKKGISLIVLVITIIVMIILAAAIILSISNSGIVDKANKAKEDSDTANLKEYVNLLEAEWELGTKAISKVEYVNAKLQDKGYKNVYYGENGLIIQGGNANNIPALNDERIGNEDIIITTSEEIYALAVILTNSNEKYTQISNYDVYLNKLKLPQEWNEKTSAQKREALFKASYRLDSDIELELNHNTDGEIFLGIGLANGTSFQGFFNGNNHTIKLSCVDENVEVQNDVWKYGGGIFGTTKNATIANLNVDVTSNILISSSTDIVKFGIVAGKSQNSIFHNVNINVNDCEVGIKFDNDSQRNAGTIGALIGSDEGSSLIEYCSVNLKNKAQILIQNTNDSDTYEYSVGGLVGWINVAFEDFSEEDRTLISNSYVTINNSSIYQKVPQTAFTGGIVGRGRYVTISDSNVVLQDSYIGTEAVEDSNNYTSYYAITTGGVIGFALPGSDNVEGIGRDGVKIENCIVLSNNTTAKEVLYSKEKKGGSPNVGGIAGVAFNNASIKNCKVNVTNGTIIAQRTEENTTNTSEYGATVGGIAGRTEHTSTINNCKVTGNNLNIIADSTEQKVYCGGIVGVDIGPYHKKQISLLNNEFVGNGTSTIEVKVIPGKVTNRRMYVGGIAGSGSYIIQNCKISGTKIKHTGSTSGSTGFAAAKIVATVNNGTGCLWRTQSYWAPDESGIYECNSQDVTIEINGEGIVTTGEIFGVEDY